MGSPALNIVLGSWTSTLLGSEMIRASGTGWRLCVCEVYLRVWTISDRRRGAASSTGQTVAVSEYAREDLDVCRHWGVSGGSGIENGKLDRC